MRLLIAPWLGARLLHTEDKEDFRVYADPAGHPFCLCRIGQP
ncbi:VOC family protein [Streptomyces muensis]